MCHLAATTCWNTCENFSLLFCHLRVCWKWLLWCCFFKVRHTGSFFFFGQRLWHNSSRCPAPASGPSRRLFVLHAASLPVLAFAPQSRSQTLGDDDDAAATPHHARSVPGSLTGNTAAGAREHASTGSQTLQTFHMERHLSACASRAGLVVAKLRHASDVNGWADDGSLTRAAVLARDQL